MGLEKLLSYWREVFYSEVALFFVEVIALAIAIVLVRKDRNGRLFIFYILFDLSLLIIDWILDAGGFKNSNQFIRKSNLAISAIELIVYCYYFDQILLNKRVKNMMNLLCTIFSVLVLTYISTEFNFLTSRGIYSGNILTAIEFSILVLPCLAFYDQIFQSNDMKQLHTRPSFWIVTGIFFFSIISIPYYLIKEYVTKTYVTNVLGAALFYTPFIVNFLFLTKAFLCRKPLVT